MCFSLCGDAGETSVFNPVILWTKGSGWILQTIPLDLVTLKCDYHKGGFVGVRAC